MMPMNKINKLKDEYPVGTVIKCILMNDNFNPVPSGTIGTVNNVDDAGQIHMIWENGQSLALVPSVDKFIKIKGE